MLFVNIKKNRLKLLSVVKAVERRVSRTTAALREAALVKATLDAVRDISRPG